MASSQENSAIKDKPRSPAAKPEDDNQAQAHDQSQHKETDNKGSTADSSKNLSHDALKPGDAAALTTMAAKPKEVSDTKLLGKLDLVETKSGLLPDAVNKAASDIHNAAFQKALWGWGWSSPDSEKIRNLLEPMSHSDRQAVEKAYEVQNPGHTLRGDLKEKLGATSDEYLKLESILNRQDGKSDEAGQVRTAMNKLENAAKGQDSRSGILNHAVEIISPGIGLVDHYFNAQDQVKRDNAEADIRKSIGALTADQIKGLKETYQKNYGVDLEQKLMSDPNMSPASKKAFEILFKGIDKRTGSDPESVKNALDLAQVGLDTKNVDIFKDAMQTASPEARKQFADNGGQNKIDKVFSGDDRDLATSYVQRGAADIGHLIEGNHHWYHTNKDEITRLVTQQASDKDREQYTRGKELADKKITPDSAGFKSLSSDDQAALSFYQHVHDGLTSAGNPREVAQWETKLLKSEAVVLQVLDSHNDGGWFGWGANTDRNKLFSSVEKLSQDDWNRLHANPKSELAKVQKALDIVADPADAKLIMQRLTDKVNAGSYEESKTIGRRPIDEFFADNKNDPAARLDRLINMSDAEKRDYIANTKNARANLDKLVGDQTQPGMERFAAQRILQEVANGGKPDHVDLAIAGALKGDNPRQTVTEIESAFKDNPALLKHPPATQADARAIENLRSALDVVVDKAGFGQQVIPMGEGGASIIPGRQDEFADKLFKTGSMPLELKVDLDKDDKIARYTDIINASVDEKEMLLSAPADQNTKLLQDRILGSDDDRAILRYGITQGKLTDADLFRAYVKGSQTQPEQLKDMLSKMTPQQRQDLANEYYTKYKSLISADVVGQVPDGEKFRFREMLSPTDVNVRQIALDAREDRDKHTSVFDPVMNKLWDKSQIGATEAQANVDKFVKEHAAEIDKLPPDQRKQFLDAVTNYQAACKNYVDSKGAFSEAVVDAAITVAAIGGAVFTGGTSFALLTAVGAGGAAFRVAVMKGIQGTDFKEDPKNYATQAFKGWVAADLGFIGPQQLGLNGIVKVGDSMATTTATSVLGRVGRQGLSDAVFKESREATQAIIARELAAVSRQSAIAGGKETEAIVQRVAASALKDSATPAEKALFEQTVRNELKEQVTTGIRNKLIHEAEAYMLNVTTATGANAGAEFLATGVGLEDPNTLWDRVKSSAISGFGGVTFFHFAFKGAGGLFKGAKALIGKDTNGLFAGEGTMVRHEDGSTSVVKEGDKYYFRKGDRVVENLQAEGPAARSEKVDADGRAKDSGRREFIKEHFQKLDPAEQAKARETVVHDLKEVKGSATATGPDGKPVSAYDKLMADPHMSADQKNRVLDLLSDVREHYASYRAPDGRMLPDQEVNWIHTQGELAKILDSAQANKLSGTETENALIASMFSDSAKFTDTAITKGNFTTHHLDGALAAAEALERRGFPPERIAAITQAIREHQIAPPEFMAFIYQTTVARNLKAQLDSGAISQTKFDEMKKVLDGMTVVGPDKMPRIKQIADINNAPLVKNGNGEWEVAFTPEQRELMKLSGTDHWYVPHDPRYLADGKTLDPEFARLSEAEQAQRISEYKSSRTLIDGDGIDNYATIGGASKIVKIRGPETFFADKTVWDSVASIDSSYKDALKVLTPEGQRLAEQSLAERNRILNDDKSGIRAQMDNWLKAQGKDPATQEIPFYNKELKYPEPLNATEQARLKELQGTATTDPAQKAQIDNEIRSLKYKGMSSEQIQDFEFAKKIRDQMTDFLRMAHRTDGSLPGRFEPVRGSVENRTATDSVTTKPYELMEYKVRPGEQNSVATPEAVNKSNAYKDNGEIKDRLPDGFQTMSGDARIRTDGTWNDPNRVSTVVDRSRDKVLNDTIAEAHRRFDGLKNNPKTLAEELAKYSKQVMNPQGWTEDMVDASYNAFRAENSGKRVLLGDFIARAGMNDGAGACPQQALLMKVLGDEFGLDVSLVSGYYGPVPRGGFPKDTYPNHSWDEVKIDGKPYVFDPRHESYGVNAADMPKHTPAREWLAGSDAPPANRLDHLDINAGDHITYRGQPGWKVSSETPQTPGNIVLTHSAWRVSSPSEFTSLNDGRKLVVGAEYNVRRSNGEVEGGWQLVAQGKDGTLQFYKSDGFKTEVSQKDLARENPDVGEIRAASDKTSTGSENGANRRPTKDEILADIDSKRAGVISENDAFARRSDATQGQKNQNEVYRRMSDRLKVLQDSGKISRDWQVEPAVVEGASDNAKADFVMVNRKTGEFHILDATANAEKAGGEKKISELHRQGIIEFDQSVFDLRQLQRNPASSTAGDEAEKQLNANIDEVLTRLSKTPSSLVLGETPFPALSGRGDVNTQITQLKELQGWLYKQGNPELTEYGREIQGSITYLENKAKTVRSSVVQDNVAGLSDRFLLNKAIQDVKANFGIKPVSDQFNGPARGDRKAEGKPQVFYRNSDQVAVISIGDKNYEVSPVKLIKDSAGKLTRQDNLLSNDQLKSLRKAPKLANLSDDQLNALVKKQITEMSRYAGNRIGANPRVIGVDDLLDKIRATDPERITTDKAELQASSRVAAQAPAVKAEKVADQYQPLEDKAASLWKELSFKPLDQASKDDVNFALGYMAEEQNLSPADRALLAKLKEGYENNDHAAIDFLRRISAVSN